LHIEYLKSDHAFSLGKHGESWVVWMVRIFDFSEVVAEVNHISIGGVFGGLSLGPWLGIN
jgi:hypothetical protein